MQKAMVLGADPLLRELVRHELASGGFDVSVVEGGVEDLDLVFEVSPEVLVLDLGHLEVREERLLQIIRAATTAAIVAVIRSSAAQDLARAYNAGADVCLPHPVTRELISACVRALARRRTSLQATEPKDSVQPIAVGALVVDPPGRLVTLDGEALDLSPLEFDLIHYLATHAGTVVTKKALLANVWHEPYHPDHKTVDVHLSRLRHKLGETAANPRYLHTIRGVGVKLVNPNEQANPPRRPLAG
jgi:two-component system, OmpR family, KDP operon response regulator KdpE